MIIDKVWKLIDVDSIDVDSIDVDSIYADSIDADPSAIYLSV